MTTAGGWPHFWIPVAVLTLAAAPACTGGAGGSGGSGGAAGEVCFDYAAWTGTAPAVSFQTDVLPVLRTSCGLSASCHGSESGSGPQHYYGPAMSAPAPTPAQIQAIFDQSVGVTAVENPGMPIVDPGHPEKSFLLYKVDGQLTCGLLSCATDDLCGAPMPQGGEISSAERDVLRRWIAQGAKND